MIKLKVSEITSPEFKTAYQKLFSMEMPFTTSYRLKRISEELSTAFNHSREKYATIINKHNPDLTEGSQPDMSKPELQEEIAAFMAEEIELSYDAIKPELFQGINLKHSEWMVLAPLFDVTEM